MERTRICWQQPHRLGGLAQPVARAGRVYVAAQPTARLQADIAEAQSPAELRAAAYLRAHSFYAYPPDRSAFAAQNHRRMKADAEWEALSLKVAGRDEAWRDVQVACLVATIPDHPSCTVAAQLGADMDRSTKLPAEGAGQLPRLAVATLDVNYGSVLPAEELVGRLPQGQAAGQRRAYLSNVCVAAAARRQGLALALMRAAEARAAQRGVGFMYVHVVHSNSAALALYMAAGYAVESEESENAAQARRRPRRILLVKQLC